ncbi:MAG: 2Fe-2S iron-sulfur cluster binding domain-containing protein [Acidobacteria bacterium]|nr:2Fe-2S iron-sulfur cluster binding domain-containing protein [Acidobacteriota bacterium]
MATIKYKGEVFSVKVNETVLDTLLNNGIAVKNSCRSGVCQSCVLKAEKGSLTEKSQQGLKDTLKTQGYFLSCMSYPENDLEIVSSTELQIPVTIIDKKMLNSDVLYIKLKYEKDFSFYAGQFINLIRNDGLTRSYSIASLPSEKSIDLHIRILPSGQMSNWLSSNASLGEKLYIEGPIGDCFYSGDKKEQPLLMVGTGTGLAPLYGILCDALGQNHQGEIHLFHGALNFSGLYLIKELFLLAEKYSNFYYYPSVLKNEIEEVNQLNQLNQEVKVGAIDKLVFQTIKKMKGWRAFLCGNPELVYSLKKQLFLAGVSLKEIYADAFLPSAK